ncbi:type II secretion system protein GspM [Vibrio diazotrophicus]|uniref:MSHA biogenesis protein MshJ n=1 Tax=Vibrio diazotrophicus TaxID=685 RepID=A0A2J8HX52_VIBDI|nr:MULTISPECIES: type II secretion system protein GspM [Vibrio]MCF7364329.1 type II secretion system protein M [Vibrio sp. A1-b2]MCZ4373863.1 type II secretion system protein GspM [Vibrio diazotrophicus]PNI02843.1 MSHA biogenesis protein MshJ [Vibrio diazotrophicus]
MNERWQKWSQQFEGRAPREKWLIAICGLIVITMVLQTLLIDPLLQQRKDAQQKLMSQQSANQRMESEIIILQRELAKDPNAEIIKELEQLQQQSQELSMQLSEVMSNLVSPSQMANLLQSVLDHSAKLKLVSLTSLPASPINETDSNAEYFLHPVRMELNGTYFAIRDYLHALESLPVKYYWRSFHYQVETYPNAKLVLEVYTLGTREEFIGG